MKRRVKDRAKKPSSRELMIIVILTIVVAIVIALAVIFTEPLGKIRLVLTNKDGYYRVHVGIYLDGKLKEIVYIEPRSSYTGVYKLARGTHNIGFDFSYYTGPGLKDIDGVVDVLHSFELTLLHPQTLSYSLSY